MNICVFYWSDPWLSVLSCRWYPLASWFPDHIHQVHCHVASLYFAHRFGAVVSVHSTVSSLLTLTNVIIRTCFIFRIVVSFSLVSIGIKCLVGGLIGIITLILGARFIVCVGVAILTSFSSILTIGCFDVVPTQLYLKVSSFSCICVLIMRFTITMWICRLLIVM